MSDFSAGIDPSTAASPEPPLLLSAEQAARALAINRSTVFELMATGQIPSVRIGRRRLISRQALAEFIAAREGRACWSHPSDDRGRID